MQENRPNQEPSLEKKEGKTITNIDKKFRALFDLNYDALFIPQYPASLRFPQSTRMPELLGVLNYGVEIGELKKTEDGKYVRITPDFGSKNNRNIITY